MNSDTKNCKVCYQIRCKQCGWVACDSDTEKIQQGIITVCPDCGWKPGMPLAYEE